MSELSEKEMLGLNLEDPDAIVEYIERFYNTEDVKSEKDLITKLTKHKPLKRAIDLQKQIKR